MNFLMVAIACSQLTGFCVGLSTLNPVTLDKCNEYGLQFKAEQRAIGNIGHYTCERSKR
jgi:hypothetical protein